MRSLSPRSAKIAGYALIALAVVAGAWLRLTQLGSQVLLDDEWHAINKLLHADAHDIATHFGFADYSIPLTLYYRFLYLHGGLSEWGMRLPMVLAGIALVALGPWLLRREARPATLALWSALLAISPFMIYHSRTARPYAVTTLLVLVAVIAFRDWWRSGSRRAAAAYVFCAFLAGWLHLITLTFTLLPFVFFGVSALRAWRVDPAATRRALARLFVLGAITALPLAVALLPPFVSDWSAMAAKAGTGAVTLESAYRSLLLAFGIASAWPCAALAALLLIGAARWWRRDAAFVAYLAVIVLGSALAVAASKAASLQHPGTYTRYLQPALPFLLLFVAEGVIVLIGRLHAFVQLPLAGAFVAGLFALGPIPAYRYYPNQFMGHPYFQFDYDPAHNPYRTELPDGPIPDFYRRLAALPRRSLVLIEAPWSLETDHDPEPLYQHVHRQRIRIGLTTPVCGVRDYGEYPEDPGMRLTQFVHLSALLRGEPAGDLLVVHRKPWPENRPPPPQWPDTVQCIARIEQRLGAPQHSDGEIAVFALSSAGREAMRTLYPAPAIE